MSLGDTGAVVGVAMYRKLAALRKEMTPHSRGHPSPNFTENLKLLLVQVTAY